MQYLTLISSIFFGFWISKIIVVSYLDHRNIKAIEAHRGEVPEDFTETVELVEHQKAADYTIAKAHFSKYSRILDNFLLAVLIPLGGANVLLTLTTSFSLGPIASGLTFFLLLGCIQFLLSTPLDFFFHFHLEEKFGFNKMTKTIFFKDLIKQVLISIILGGIILSLILIIMHYLTYWWVYAWIATFSFQMIMLLLYPRVIAPLFNKFTPLEQPEYLTEIENLVRDTKFPAKDLFIMDASVRSSHGNAYFTGFGKQKRIVFFDTLLKTLAPKEVKAVLAHEIGHYAHKHILKSLIKLFLLSGLFFYLLYFLQNKPEFYLGHFIHSISNHSTLFLFFTLLPVYTFWLKPIATYFSRKNEFEADLYAKKYADAEDLVSALVKLYKENASTLVVDKWYAQYYYSHPPASERIKNLRTD